jgi:hypothetical protein
MSNICGVSPVNQVINAYVRNIDAVDVAADSVSCTNLTVNGENISGLFQNVTSIPNKTTFTGNVEATGFVAGSNGIGVSGDLVVFPPGKLRVNGNIEQSGVVTTTLKGTTVDTLAVKGNSELHGTTISGSATVSGDLQAGLIVDTNISAPGGYADLGDVTASSVSSNAFTSLGNIAQTAGTTSLKQLSVGGNIAQTSGTTSLKALTCDTLTLSSGGIITYTPVTAAVTTGNTVTVSGISASANILEVTLSNIGLNNNNALYLRVGTGGSVITTTLAYRYATRQTWSATPGYTSIGTNSATNGWTITNALNNGERIYGTYRLVRVGNVYVMDGQCHPDSYGVSGADQTINYFTSGMVTVNGAIDRINISTGSGTAFNGTGTIQVIAR